MNFQLGDSTLEEEHVVRWIKEWCADQVSFKWGSLSLNGFHYLRNSLAGEYIRVDGCAGRATGNAVGTGHAGAKRLRWSISQSTGTTWRPGEWRPQADFGQRDGLRGGHSMHVKQLPVSATMPHLADQSGNSFLPCFFKHRLI